jgi:cytochrome c551/c552
VNTFIYVGCYYVTVKVFGMAFSKMADKYFNSNEVEIVAKVRKGQIVREGQIMKELVG